jgi:hypothetical protein
MQGTEHGTDILSAMPVWVQVSANLGMFVVAVIAAAYGFVKRRVGAFVPEQHFSEGGQFHTLGDDLREGIETLKTISETLADMLAIQRETQRQDDIDREVERRVKEQSGKARA